MWIHHNRFLFSSFFVCKKICTFWKQISKEEAGIRITCKYSFTYCKTFLYSSFPLLDSDADSDVDWNSKPNGYIVLCRTCFHWLKFRFGSLSHSTCITQESVFESESESESGSGNKPSEGYITLVLFWIFGYLLQPEGHGQYRSVYM